MFASQRAFRPPTSVSLRCVLAVAIGGICAGAHADDGPGVRFSGFGTLAVTHISTKLGDFASVNQTKGAGHSYDYDINPDSKIGLQLDGKLNQMFSASGQVLVRKKYDNTDRPELTMLFAKWQATPSVSFRAGRMLYPVFLISDYRNVGFAQTTLRPPNDLYNGFARYAYDGADVTWTTEFHDFAIKTNAYAGNNRVRNAGSQVNLQRLAGANVQAEIGDLTFRLSYIDFLKFERQSSVIDAAFNKIRNGTPATATSPAVAGNPALADEWQLHNLRTSFTSAGFSYDPGRWFVMAEATYTGSAALSGAKARSYVTLGGRVDKFTPFVTYQQDIESKKPGASTGNSYIEAQRTGGARAGEKTVSLGMRYDLVKNVDLKVQFDHVKTNANSVGQLINIQPGFVLGSSYNIFAAAVDFVF